MFQMVFDHFNLFHLSSRDLDVKLNNFMNKKPMHAAICHCPLNPKIPKINGKSLNIPIKVGSFLSGSFLFELIPTGKSLSRLHIIGLHGGKKQLYKNMSFSRFPKINERPLINRGNRRQFQNSPGAKFLEFVIFRILTCKHDYSWKKTQTRVFNFHFFLETHFTVIHDEAFENREIFSIPSLASRTSRSIKMS